MPPDREWPPADDREFDFLREGLASRLFQERPFPDPPRDLDWKRLYSLLMHHRLSAHFYVLGKSKRNSWPNPFRERLRLDRYSLIIFSEQFVSRIKPVLAELTKANIPIMLLKGWALIQMIYGGDYGQRVYSDIDFLVRLKDADIAEKILTKLGWQVEDDHRPGFTHRYHNAQAYYFEQPEIPRRVCSIGLHWGLLHHPAYNPNQIDVEKLFFRAQLLKIANIPVLGMSIEDHVVYNCAHIVLQHQSEQSLLWYYEIAAIIKDADTSLDWQKVEEYAKCWKLVLPLKKVAKKIEEFWPGIVPAPAMASVINNKPAISEQFIHSWYERTNYNPSLEHLLTWLTMSGLIRRITFIFEDIFPNVAYLEKEYGAFAGIKWPLVYIRRLVRVFGRILK